MKLHLFSSNEWTFIVFSASKCTSDENNSVYCYYCYMLLIKKGSIKCLIYILYVNHNNIWIYKQMFSKEGFKVLTLFFSVMVKSDIHRFSPHVFKWKPPCSTNVNTFQHCRYAVAREWIVNANVLTVLIVASLRWHRDDLFNLLQTQQHKQN